MWLNSVYLLNGLNFLAIRHISGSLQSAYLSEELKGLLCYQNSFFSASGGLRPWLLDQGLCPGPRWGLRPQTPVIGSRSAFAMASPTDHSSEEIAATEPGFQFQCHMIPILLGITYRRMSKFPDSGWSSVSAFQSAVNHLVLNRVSHRRVQIGNQLSDLSAIAGDFSVMYCSRGGSI